MKNNTLSLRVIAHLLRYPDDQMLAHLDELHSALHDEAAVGAARLGELTALLARLGSPDVLATEAEYVETFDRARGTALHMFEHVHGDSRDRGPAMIDLVKTFEQAGLYIAPGELPDHLSVLLEYASTQPPAAARSFLREFSHILQAVFKALAARQSPYACAVAALLDLAGEAAPAAPVLGSSAAALGPAPTADETEALDESWAEPPVFGGCSTVGQASPGQPQPIQITPRRAPTSAGQRHNHPPGAQA